MKFDFSLFKEPTFWIVVSITLVIAVTLTIAIKIVKKTNTVKADRGSVAVGGDSHAPIKIKNEKKTK